MPTCPQCTKPLREFSRRCPSCQADLDLLVDYVSQLQGGLERAENLTHSGELGKAFWAYLEVLETDPDNAAARRQVGQVVTAIAPIRPRRTGPALAQRHCLGLGGYGWVDRGSSGRTERCSAGRGGVFVRLYCGPRSRA